jgi:hypothetical protein
VAPVRLSACLRPTIALLEDRVLRLRSSVGVFPGDFGSGGGSTGIEGTVASRRGPPGTVGVGAASNSSSRLLPLKKLLENSTCHGVCCEEIVAALEFP